ncbi:uncharacterized protein LOC105203882 [Solenopsis invicta]|uniref:uncharacterized protein LOC105203882 n=1 Tax=Solenopsis invicta TaxID=13686 RepID=UPI000595A4B2|nr:uncharacterized protein LOC105203882 [Solenopsis invicta]
MSVPTQPDDDTQISSYRVPKIPPFWRDDPETWFLQVEATFRVANCKTDRTKVDFLISALESEVVKHVRDLVTADPPPEDFYQTLKKRILSTFSTSSEARLRQLLKGQPLGDQKLSHLLSHMHQLNNGQCTTAILKSLFLEQLPESQRAILVAINEPGLQKMAEIADKIADISSPDLAIAPIRAHPNIAKSRSHENTNDLSDIKKQISELSKPMDALENKVTKPKRDRPTPCSRDNSKQRDEQKTGLCFAHQKYGKDATACRKACKHWPNSESAEN